VRYDSPPRRTQLNSGSGVACMCQRQASKLRMKLHTTGAAARPGRAPAGRRGLQAWARKIAAINGHEPSRQAPSPRTQRLPRHARRPPLWQPQWEQIGEGRAERHQNKPAHPRHKRLQQQPAAGRAHRRQVQEGWACCNQCPHAMICPIVAAQAHITQPLPDVMPSTHTQPSAVLPASLSCSNCHRRRRARAPASRPRRPQSAGAHPHQAQTP